MVRRVLLTMAALTLLCTAANAAVVVTAPAKPSPMERLASLELQRYIYLRTGEMPRIGSGSSAERIIVAHKSDTIVSHAVTREAKALGAQQYIIKTTRSGKKITWWIVGGDDTGTLYGAYRFIEKLGVRFYLHGDVIPDKQIKALPAVNETGKPIFSVRGIQPFHDFPEGPDWWDTNDYIAYIGQLAKMRMNFIGLHCYPGGMAEPSVWIGLPSDVAKDGQVNFSYPARWANTALDKFWGYKATRTSDYCAGASQIFSCDNYGDDMMDAMFPTPANLACSNTVFNNAGMSFNLAFRYAKSIGVKTCLGTETPITVPGPVAERLKQQGKNPADPKVVEELYKGIFTRIARACPVDYYWLWTPEAWTAWGNTEAQTKATGQDIQCALDALRRLGDPFTLATCGWVLGPTQDRTALDRVLPKNCPMSCINRNVGHAAIEPAFGEISGRPKWAIPWMENDPVLTAPQPWVGRMRFDAADAKRLGCTGLLGIHWRTKAMAQNVSALAQAGWDQSWAPKDFGATRKIIENGFGPQGGGIATYSDPVANTDEDPVYQSVRYNMDAYRLQVPKGTYTVTLKFNEPHYSDPGKRVFGVKLQGKLVIDQLDMIAQFGKDVAHDYTYPDTRVDNGLLRLDFVKEVEYPCIAGIVIVGRTDGGMNYIRRINCGGPAYAGYEADNNQQADLVDRRSMPVEDFYIDFARASFGDAVAVDAGRIMAKVDSRGMPEPVGWIGGPGCVRTNREPWEKVREQYAFVDKFAALRGRVISPGDLTRFDYWLNTYRNARSLAELGCARGQLDMKMEAIAAATDPTAKLQLAEQALTVREHMSRLWEQAITQLLETVDTPGEMGTLDNMERHSRGQMQFVDGQDKALETALGTALPADLDLSKAYTGTPRIFVPTVRTQANPGERIRLKVMILDKNKPTSAALYWRPLGHGAYKKMPLPSIGRSVYEIWLPRAKGSFEYYISTNTSGGQLTWPTTAPKLNQTVVVW